MQDRPTVSAYRPDTNFSNSAATTSGLAGHSNEERAGIRRRTISTTTTALSSSAGSEGPGTAATAPVAPVLRVAPGMPWANVGLASSPAPTLPHHPASQEKAEAPSSWAPVANLSERRLRQRQGEASTDSSPSSMIPSSMSIFPLSGASAGANMEVEVEHSIAQGSDSMSVNQYLSSNTAEAGYSSVSSTRKRPAHATQCDTDDLSDSHPGASSTSKESAERKPSAQDDASPMEQSSINSGVVQVVEGTGSGTVGTESTRQREERVLARDTRLRCVVQELCPLIDRFGRVLTDLAPHLWEMGALDASLVQDSAAEQQQNPTNFEASLLSLLRNRYDNVFIIMQLF